MARDAAIEARLQRWAQYVVVGDGTGYPTRSVLDQDWLPPSPGVMPTLKAAPKSDVRQTHAAIGQLSLRLRNTVVVHYCYTLSVAEQAARLECEPPTVHARIVEAHRQLAALLAGPGSFCSIESLG